MYTDPVVEYLFEDKRAERATLLYTDLSRLSAMMTIKAKQKEAINWLPVLMIRDTESNTVAGGAIWIAPECVPGILDYIVYLRSDLLDF